MRIAMLDLPAEYLRLENEIDLAIKEVLRSGQYIMGRQIREFEEQVSLFLGVKHAIGVASGTDALLLALHALDIRAGDKVIVPAFTFIAAAEVVSRRGAIPIFADIDPVTFNLDCTNVRSILSRYEGIKAIIPVHLFGRPCDMEEIMELAEEYHLRVVEDACQAVGAEAVYRGAGCKAASIGDAGCLSFFPSKNLGCYGDGGMVVSNDDALAEKIRALRTHGSGKKYYHDYIGYNSRLDTLQAAILKVKMKYLGEMTKKRRSLATMYNAEFRRQGLDDKVLYPQITAGHVFNQYAIQVDNRDGLASYLNQKGISSAVYYPLPLHLQGCYTKLGYRQGDLPGAERLCRRVLALPIDPGLRDSDVRYVVEVIRDFYLARGRT